VAVASQWGLTIAVERGVSTVEVVDASIGVEGCCCEEKLGNFALRGKLMEECGHEKLIESIEVVALTVVMADATHCCHSSELSDSQET
jgi:hypothetical protein